MSGFNKHSYYRNTGKPFIAKKDGHCNNCKKPIKKGEMIQVIFWTDSKTPVHEKC